MSHDLEQLTTQPAAFWPRKKRPQRFTSFADFGTQTCDVAVVGGGWVGLFAAYYLAKEGKSVVLVEKNLIGDEASGHSGGLMLDKFEGDIRDLMKICGKENTDHAGRILQASYEAMSVIADVARMEGFDSGYRNFGYVTGFRNRQERARYIKAHEQVRDLVPILYPDDANSTIMTASQTGAPGYFKGGGAHAPQGGVFNPRLVVEGLIKALRRLRVRVYEKSEVVGFEPAYQGVRLMIGKGFLEAGHVVLAGGQTSSLIEGLGQFPSPQPIIAAMLATHPLSPAQVRALANDRGAQVPVMSVGIGVPYYRFTEDNRLLFGSGARAGWNEFSEISKDVGRDLLRVFPSLNGKVDPDLCHSWGRMLYHSGNDLPFVYAVDNKRQLQSQWPPTLSGTPIVGVAGLGGQGNNFGPYLGQMVARAFCGDEKANDILRHFQMVSPKAPLAIREAKSRLAAERRM